MGLFDTLVGGPLKVLGLEPSSLPVVGGMFENPANKRMQKHIRQMIAEMQQSRAMFPEARMNVLRQQIGALTPANRMTGAIAGPEAMVQTGGMFENPFPVGHPSNPSPEMLAEAERKKRGGKATPFGRLLGG